MEIKERINEILEPITSSPKQHFKAVETIEALCEEYANKKIEKIKVIGEDLKPDWEYIKHSRPGISESETLRSIYKLGFKDGVYEYYHKISDTVRDNQEKLNEIKNKDK